MLTEIIARIVPVRDMAYEDAKSEIIEHRNNNNTWISELVEVLWLDIESDNRRY